mmetsp:Transcript_73926/g.154075  ORF Transcript_73926/g.154075 Transcript_73926/m.154075 type:complete len:230 (-) Transcript_73926:237-926(-)
MPPRPCATMPSIAFWAALAEDTMPSSSDTPSTAALELAALALAAQALEPSFRTSSSAETARATPSMTTSSSGSSSSPSKSSKSSAESPSPSSASASSFSFSFWLLITFSSSLAASRIWVKDVSSRLLAAERFPQDTRSKCFTLSKTCPAKTAMFFEPTAPPRASRLFARLEPTSQSSFTKVGPAPFLMESKVPAAAVKALTNSGAIDFKASSFGPSATAADAANFVTEC